MLVGPAHSHVKLVDFGLAIELEDMRNNDDDDDTNSNDMPHQSIQLQIH